MCILINLMNESVVLLQQEINGWSLLGFQGLMPTTTSFVSVLSKLGLYSLLPHNRCKVFPPIEQSEFKVSLDLDAKYYFTHILRMFFLFIILIRK